ncbi:MAG: ABC transporter ATP-binding protein [Candidatus Omnitrophica bacterium]|nr:ABC transporter ATP-binding protein [Candidatus Omnitrophota bacterium]
MIEVINLHKSFDGHRVLDGVNLTIRDGETMVVIGRSGGGKSVLLKHMIGLMMPDEGQVIVDGTEISRPGAHHVRADGDRGLGFAMLFQGAALFDSLTVGENVAFPLREHTQKPEEEIQARVRECLGLVGLAGIEHLKPAELSGGMKKRVGLARALALQPKVILYDEPTTGIDPIMSDTINKLIKGLHDRLKVTSIVVTHDMVSAYFVGDRIAMLHEGKIEEVGTVEQVRNTKNSIVRQFILGKSENGNGG